MRSNPPPALSPVSKPSADNEECRVDGSCRRASLEIDATAAPELFPTQSGPTTPTKESPGPPAAAGPTAVAKEGMWANRPIDDRGDAAGVGRVAALGAAAEAEQQGAAA